MFQDLALCDNLDVVANLFLGRELVHRRALDEVEMEKESWRLLRQLVAKIPSVRIPVASLSGGQRQTVAIARSLLGEPKVVMLDEPTAALGVAQTAEVLNLVERLRERGLGVILISHNMADVMAVADRVVVLRLGRNNGVFRRQPDQRPGDHRRDHRRHDQRRLGARRGTSHPRRSSREHPDPRTTGATDGREGDPTAVRRRCPADLQDERLIASQRHRRLRCRRHRARLRSGDLGSLPVVIGLIIIWVVFQSLNPPSSPAATSSTSRCRCAAVGTIAIGIVLVLLLGEIDLSVGSVSGLAAAILGGALRRRRHWPLVLAMLAAIAAGAVVGLVYGCHLHPLRRAELRHHPGRPARLPRPPARCSAARARSTSRSPPPGRRSRQQQFLPFGVAVALALLAPILYAVSALRRNAPSANTD